MSSVKPTYLALGDSYTIGESVLPSERWPVMLAEQLQWNPPQIIATTGWTTSELLDGIRQTILANVYDWISLLIGVNNQYRGQGLDEYQKDLNQLAQVMLPLVDHQPNRVFLLSIPDYGVTPFAKEKNPEKISQELSQFNHANQAFAAQQGFQYCNITEDSLLAKERSDYLAEDQLHPSVLMYKAWVDKVLQNCKFS
ncbi:SGNH/GDSL hydrolase family protein [Catalinimonas niigatensis]|uniref:SGNH/GDSL hydrolase family protein n=1 Tax=Catalinimonas niigatensis TaxID=1397264 RepID=UPI00266659D5|nr:GDSL-type esterase/lipase family protein [Catalinimonas niigatensis]WPP50906.1 GDSL-type esterase/lipase family protein [Catalinimonas niigatensis]